MYSVGLAGITTIEGDDDDDNDEERWRDEGIRRNFFNL